MEIEVFNLTDEKIDELDKLKEFLINVSNDEKLGNVIFNVIIVDNNKIKEINRDYRNKDSETDVISFAFEESDDYEYPDMRLLGEIYISIDKAKSQAEEYGHSLKREICFLTVHGLLHLLGYDHIEEKDRVVMRKLEEEILESYDAKR